MTSAEIGKLLTKAVLLPAAGQIKLLERLTLDELDEADQIMSGRRSAGGHAETPIAGSDDVCDHCGVVNSSNRRVQYAYHPAAFPNR
jgi:hypothetical protein